MNTQQPSVIERPGRDAEPRLIDCAAAASSFRLDVPERFNPVPAIVETWAAESPDDPAVLSLDAAGDIVQLDSIGNLALPSRKAARALLGCMRIGAVPMPGPNLLMAKDIKDRITRAEATGAITDAAGAVKVDAAIERLSVRLCVGDDPPAGWTSFAAASSTPATVRRRRTRPTAMTRCSCTSRAARSRCRRWSSTRRRTASGTCRRRASGMTCDRVICTER